MHRHRPMSRLFVRFLQFLAALLLLGAVLAARGAPAQANGPRVVSFYVTTQQAYSTWAQSHQGAPPAITTFPLVTRAVAFYLHYQDALPRITTAQVLIYDTYFSAQGYVFATDHEEALLYQNGYWMDVLYPDSSLFRSTSFGYIGGPYRADLLVDGRLAASVRFRVGPVFAPFAPTATCTAHDVESVVSCDEPSILRLEGAKVAGTGFVVQSDRTGTYVLTNRHVVAPERVSTLHAYSPNGRAGYRVLAIRMNQAAEGSAGDLAIVKLSPTDLRPLAWGNANNLAAGQTVVSIGYALDLPGPPTVTEGIVSAVGRDIGDGYGPVWIQHQSVINHGNSGGPLLTLNGQVVGVNTFSPDQTQGMFFAISSNWERQVAARLIGQMQR